VEWRNLDSVDLQENGEIHNPLWFWDGHALWVVSFRQKLFCRKRVWCVAVAHREPPRGFLERGRAPSWLLTIRDRVARRAFRRKAEQFSRCDGYAVFARCGGCAVLAALRPRDDFEATSPAMWCSVGIRRAMRRLRRDVAREGASAGPDGELIERLVLLLINAAQDKEVDL